MRRWGLPLLGLLTACAQPGPMPLTSGECQAPHYGSTTLYLRGSMNNWAALDEYALQWQCDAYLLNVAFDARHDFKIADAAWSPPSTFGARVGTAGDLTLAQPYALVTNAESGVTANLRFAYAGEQTLRLVVKDGLPTLAIGPKSFNDPRARAVSDPVALAVRYDSRDLGHKQPFGAQRAGTEVQFRLHAPAGVEQATLVIESRRLEGNQELLEYQTLQRLTMRREGAESYVASYRFDAVGVYGYWFEVLIGGQRYAYQNNRDSVFWTRERGSGGVGEIAFLPEQLASIRRFRQTVYAPDFMVPSWAPDIVYYYIFPERFRNGDPGNDPVIGARTFHQHPIEVHQDWNEPPFVPHSGDGSDAWSGNDFYGGDIAGIIEKLDYIRELGANTLYLTPLFYAASNHKYDTADYRRIDPAFGTEADFQRLTAEAARRGIRVLPDTSLNHSGSDSIYFDRHSKYPEVGAFEQEQVRSDSPYASWYKFKAEAPSPDQRYVGWTGVADLPELNKDSADYRRYAFGPDGVMQHWLDLGAAGWRMDVAPWVPDDFWRAWRRAVKTHRPDALTVAETWFDASKYFLGDTFDSTMNYIVRNTLIEYAAGGDARKLYPNIEHMREAYPPQAYYALMNLLSTHDQARTLHLLGAHDDADAATIALAKRRFLLAMLLQMSLPGAPTLYYGDEVGVTGGDDPQNRRTYPWADQGGHPDLELWAQVRALIGLRQAHPVLRRGSLGAPLALDEHLIVLERRLGSARAWILSNNAAEPRRYRLNVPACAGAAQVRDLLGDGWLQPQAGSLEVEVPAWSGRVLLLEDACLASLRPDPAAIGPMVSP
ncbi:MAG: glycoside hydrolase family 13 protein [Lysobacterales bacterium]